MDDKQHPQLQGNKKDHGRQARQACEFGLRDIGERNCHQSQQCRKHSKIRIGMPITRKGLIADYITVHVKLTMQHMQQHAAEKLIKFLGCVKSKGTVTQQQKVVCGNNN